MPVATDTGAGSMVIKAIKEIPKLYKGSHTVVGLSNISFGLPDRASINANFLVLCMNAGLSAAIVDPTDNNLMRSYKITNTLYR